MKNMTDVQQMQTLYDQYGSYKRVAREMNASRNTVKKYLRLADEVRDGTRPAIFSTVRVIIQARRVVTDEIISFVYALLKSNRNKPKKLRLTAKTITDHLHHSGYQVSYSTVKKIINNWNQANGLILSE